MSGEIPAFEAKEITKRAMLAGVTRALGLLRRVPELMRARGWPQDQELVDVLCIAVACKKLGAGGTRIRRPRAAGGLGGLWPEKALLTTAKHVVDTLELDDLLVAR